MGGRNVKAPRKRSRFTLFASEANKFFANKAHTNMDVFMGCTMTRNPREKFLDSWKLGKLLDEVPSVGESDVTEAP